MKKYFGGPITRDAKAHAIAEFPKESCGIVVKNRYHPCKNTATNPETDFRIHPSTYMKYERTGKIQAIIHSHNDFAGASKNDMVHQISTAVPWGIINMIEGKPREVIFWGDQLPTQDFLERPFYSGIYDCFSLVRDVYRDMYNVILPNIPREPDFWSDPKGATYFEEQMAWMVPKHLKIVSKHRGLEDGDGLLFKLGTRAGGKSTIWNHCGLCIENGWMIHHVEDKLSRRVAVMEWFDRIDTVVRPTKMEKKLWKQR